MAKTILEIKHWGNGLGVRLPALIAKEASLSADQRVALVVRDGGVFIEPIHDRAETLAQRLARFDPSRHGGEAMVADDRIGAERW